MKTLKKIVALVLVVATIASLCLVGASAAYSEETKYPEAAAVVKALGIIEGYDDGTMQYDKPVTREEAAKIICYALLGKANADALKTGTAPFADVKATDWSAGYIAYLKAQGVIDGVSDTEFAPKAGVTGIAFAKMLLTAIGYGAKGEFDGGAWDINTITLANDNKIYTGTKAADLTAAATREECMLYAFNTIVNAPVVKYNATFDTYYWGQNVLDTNTAREDCTLAKTKFNMAPAADFDVFGRPVVDYKLNNVVVADNIQAVAPTYTFANKVSGADLYNKVGATAALKVTTIERYVDGELVAFDIANFNKNAKGVDAYFQPVEAELVAKQGAKTEVYVRDNGTKLLVVVVYEHIAQVSTVNTTTGVVTLTNGDDGIIAGVAMNDYVVYTKDADAATTTVAGFEVVKAAKAAPVAGTMQSINAYGQPVVGGVAYTASAKINGTMPAAADFGKAYNVYTDSLGNVLAAIYVPTTVVSNDYLYLLNSTATVANDSVFNTQPASAKLQVVYANGGTAVVNYKITKANDGKYMWTLPGSTTATEVAGTTVATAGKWYSYITDDAGNVTLVKEAGAANTNTIATSVLDVAKGKYAVAGTTAKAYSKTVLNVVNEDGEVTTYTGIANFPTWTANVTPSTAKAYNTMIVLDAYGTTVEAINAYAGADSTTVKVPVIGYCASLIQQDADGYHYNFYINGKLVKVTNTTALIPGSAYNVTAAGETYVVGTDYTVVKAAKDTNGLYVDACVIKSVDDQYFILKDGTALYYNTATVKTVVYDLAANGAAGTLAAGRAITYSVSGDAVVYVWMH